MTKLEKEMCENKDWVCFAKLTDAQRAIIAKTPENQLQYLHIDGSWKGWINPSFAPTVTHNGAIYRINPEVKVECEYLEYQIYQRQTTCFGLCWSFGPDMELLMNGLMRVNFAGIRYQDSPVWRGVLNPVEYGVPVAVRFTK